MIRQGDLYWVDFPDPYGSEAGYRHPVVVIQNDVVNASGIHTVIVCVSTTNLNLAKARGNVLLNPREGDLPQRSVIIASQVTAIDKSLIHEDQYIGRLSRRRVIQIIEGINILLQPRDLP